MKNKLVVYSALIGDIDEFQEPKFNIPGCDLVIFTDNVKLNSKHFEVRLIQNFTGKVEDNRRFARMLKTLPHIFIPEYESSIWIDSRLEILRPDLKEMAEGYLKEHDCAIFKHYHRDTLFQEHEEIIKRKKANAYIVKKQMQTYLKEGYDNSTILAETTSIIRRHMSPTMVKFDEEWWKEIQTMSIRDQMSFPYVYWKNPELKLTVMDGFVWDNQYFKMGEHNLESKNYTGREKKVDYVGEFLDYLKWSRINVK